MKISYRYKNLIELDYHINASFDGIRETGFWDNGSEIPNDWWFRNSDFETNYSHSSSVKGNNLLCEFYDHDDSSVYDRALIKTHACEFYDLAFDYACM